MSNIVINEACNLNCPYCFANEFVNKKPKEISIHNFRDAVKFIKTSAHFNGRIGIIGGEPTLHSELNELLKEVNQDTEITHCVIYTNGVLVNEFVEQLLNEKYTFLINLNSPDDIGKKTYSKILNNINILIQKGINPRSITLGINIYKEDFDYNYFLLALKEFKLSSARLAVTVPPFQSNRNGVTIFKYKDIIYNLYLDIMAMGIYPIFDCNKSPLCMWNDLEKKKINFFQREFQAPFHGINIRESRCNPVIDILPDLTAIRCFGLSEFTKQDTRNYRSIDDLSQYYSDTFDHIYSNLCSFSMCESCDDRITGKCYGGCLSEKINLM